MHDTAINVLVVEDDNEQRQLVCDMLVANNFQYA